MNKLTTVCFDADDTLWENEIYFRAAEQKFCNLLSGFADAETVKKGLFKQEVLDIPYFGFGVKGFTFSMVQTAINLSNYKVNPKLIESIITIGKELLVHPVELIEGAEKTLACLKKKYRLALATKGDLQHQESKIKSSGLAGHFDLIQVLSDKKEADYLTVLGKLSVSAEEFAMVGNSLKSDIIPVVNLGAIGFYVPHDLTWEHEKASDEGLPKDRYIQLKKITDLAQFL